MTGRSLVIGGIALVVLGVVALAAWLRNEARGYEPDCDSYSFDRGEWESGDFDDDGRENQAEALAECGELEGLSRREVAAMLGPRQKNIPGTNANFWMFDAGWVNDDGAGGSGPGCECELRR